MRELWSRFARGNVKLLAVVAGLSLVLGGGAYAASKISGKRLKNHSVSEKKLTKAVIAKLNRAGTPGAAGTPGQAGASGQNAASSVATLPGSGFLTTNGSCSLTPDGVNCGPYANGATSGGSIQYNGLNGQRLSAVKNLVYFSRYTSTGDTGGVGSPYLRIFLNNDNNDAIFSPNTQPPDSDTQEGPFHTWVATSGVWRYDDDAGSGGQYGLNGAPFSQLKTDHGTDVISGIFITTGFGAGTNLNSLTRSLQVNGTTFAFGG